MWYNGNSTWITLDDELATEGHTPINMPNGDINDESALIFPMKAFYAVQPADVGTNKLVVPNLFPTNPETAYWKNWDWNLAAQGGQAVAGREFSGELGWAETVMYWPLTHQVSPADQALQCTDCHTEDGRLDFAALGYAAERAAILQTFPPVEPTPEPTPTEVPPTPTEEPTPTTAPTEEPAPAEEAAPAVEEPSADAEVEVTESSSSILTWVLVIGAVVIVAVVIYFLTQRKK
jgi:hypothetical protein